MFQKGQKAKSEIVCSKCNKEEAQGQTVKKKQK